MHTSLGNIAHGIGQYSGLGNRIQTATLLLQTLGDQGGKESLLHGKLLFQLHLIGNCQLCAVRGGGGSQIRNIIGDRHIRLVTDGRNHRDLRGGNGICHFHIIKGPQILNRAPSPAGNDQIRKLMAVGKMDGSCDLCGSFRSLYPYGEELHRG